MSKRDCRRVDGAVSSGSFINDSVATWIKIETVAHIVLRKSDCVKSVDSIGANEADARLYSRHNGRVTEIGDCEKEERIFCPAPIAVSRATSKTCLPEFEGELM